MQFGAWEVSENGQPARLTEDRHTLEANLETWIERDPSLLADDVRWVSRQLVLPDRRRLDLLGLTRDGTWVIAELKAGPVDSETVRQVLNYLLTVAPMSNLEFVQRIRSQGLSDPEVDRELDDYAAPGESVNRDYMLLVAGVGTGESAEEAASVLEQFGFSVPVRVVTFSLMDSGDGRRVLVREVDDEIAGAGAGAEAGRASDGPLAQAERDGVRVEMEQMQADMLAQGYRCYRKPTGLNFNPWTRKQAFWVRSVPGAIHMGYLSSNFPKLFGIDEHTAEASLGGNWIDLPPREARQRLLEWVDSVKRLQASAGIDHTDLPTSS